MSLNIRQASLLQELSLSPHLTLEGAKVDRAKRLAKKEPPLVKRQSGRKPVYHITEEGRVALAELVTLRVRGIVCPECKYFVYSRARHDMRYCPCSAVYVDGGQSEGESGYIRTGGKHLCEVQFQTLIGPAREDLYDDWNYSLDKLGHIHQNEQVWDAAL